MDSHLVDFCRMLRGCSLFAHIRPLGTMYSIPFQSLEVSWQISGGHMRTYKQLF